jgi:hypothetical protein
MLDEEKKLVDQNQFVSEAKKQKKKRIIQNKNAAFLD